MLKSLLSITTAAVLLAAPALAHAETSPYYVGGQYAKQTVEIDTGFGNLDLDFGTVALVGGYKVNQYFAVEARYAFGVKDESFSDEEYSTKIKVNNQMALLAKGIMPLSDEFSVFAVAGYSKTEYKTSFRELEISGSEKDSENGIMYGIGAEYHLNDKFSLSLEYAMLPDLEDDEDDSAVADVSQISVGVSYHF